MFPCSYLKYSQSKQPDVLFIFVSKQQMERQGENMKVIVRVRPMSRKEEEGIENYVACAKGKKKGGKAKMAQVALNFFTKYHGVSPGQVMVVGEKRVSVCDQEYKNTERKMRDYCFGEVFGCQRSNADIFEGSVRKELQGVFQGINCTLMAYGITGSGKTYSVFGQGKQHKGLSCLAFQHLLMRKGELQAIGATVDMKFSFIEIYNQNIRDLLSQQSRKNITISQQKGTVTLLDTTQTKIQSQQQLSQLILLGTAKRSSATTDSNLLSSRSHAILKLSVDTLYKGHRSTSKLYVIDLAGSQKLNLQSGVRKNQGSNINKSLLTLGNCINGLVQNGKKMGSAHVPYRDSKLTRLLKDSLGGSARVIMLACISANPFTLEETITTLNYAERAQGIRKEVVRNVRQVDSQCLRCKEMMASAGSKKGEVAQDVSLWQSVPEMGRTGEEVAERGEKEDMGVFMDVCEKLYQDIVENARQAQQIQRLRNDIFSPCEEFEMILKDNEQQRVHLKEILFNLLKEKVKIVVKDTSVKEQQTKGPSSRKKIRLSSAKKPSHGKQDRQEKEEKDDRYKSRGSVEKKAYTEIQDNLNEFTVGMSTPFHSPQESSVTNDRRSQSRGRIRDENGYQSQTGSKRKRSKFEKVPRPSSMKKSSQAFSSNVLTDSCTNQQWGQ